MSQQKKDAAGRRQVLSGLTAVAVSQAKWIAPVVTATVLPAHATTSVDAAASGASSSN